MIRKAIIVVLTLGVVASVALGLVSYYKPWTWQSDLVPVWVLFEVKEGTVEGLYSYPIPVPPVRRAPKSWQALGFAYLERSNVRVHELRAVSGLVDPACFRRYEDSAVLHCRTFRVEFPFWAPVIVLVAYPTIAFIRGPLRRWRRRRRGLCVKCGYDLTGNVTGVCPECATPT